MQIKVYVCNGCELQLQQYYYNKQVLYYCTKCKSKVYHGSVSMVTEVRVLNLEVDLTINKVIDKTEVFSDIIIEEK